MLASPLQLPSHGQYLALERFGGEWPDLLVSNDALLVDDKGLRHAIYAIVDADAPVPVDHRRSVGVAVLLQPRLSLLRIVLVIETVDWNEIGSGELHQKRVLDATGDTPRCPHVEQPHLALQFVSRKRSGSV